jgi:hypothetical protein
MGVVYSKLPMFWLGLAFENSTSAESN